MSQTSGNSPGDAVTDPVASPFKLKVVVASGPDFAQELVLDDGTYRIGTDPTCDLVLSDAQVSRFHLQVEVRAEGPHLTDLDSTNGSFCEGVRFKEIDGYPGANLKLARTELKLLPVLPRGALAGTR